MIGDIFDIEDDFIVIKKHILVSYDDIRIIRVFSNIIAYLKNGYKCFYTEKGEPINNQYIKNLKFVSNLLKSNNINPKQLIILYENNTDSHINYLNELGFEHTLCIKWITGATTQNFIENNYLSNDLDKKFLFLNRVKKGHRVELYEYFKDSNIINNSYYSVKWLNESNFKEDYQSEKVKLRVDVHDHLIDVYNQSYIHIVTETKYEDVIENIDVSFFSEKTFRHLAFNRPFILVAQKNSIKTLKSYGFKTFGEFIDESYDELDYDERMGRIKEIIFDLNKKSNKELFEMCKECETIFQHNRLHLFEFAKSIQNNISKKYPQFFKRMDELISNYKILC